jgi:hypothetical protein
MSISSGTDRLELHAGLRLAGLIRHMGEVTGGR